MTEDFSVIDREGHGSESLFAVGPLLRGTLWETTAVPELRSQTFRLARTIAEQLDLGQPDKFVFAETIENVMEYSI